MNPPRQYRSSIFIGIDVGGTKIAGGLVDENGTLLGVMTEQTDTTSESAAVQQIIRLVRTLREKQPTGTNIAGIGVGAPGNVDSEAGIVAQAVNTRWKEVRLKDTLESALEIPTFVENDTNAAILGEKWYGLGQNLRDFVYLSLGTGIGLGIVVHGELYRGMGQAGEIGHIIMNDHGPRCRCGSVGCLEALASGPAIARRTVELLKSNRNDHDTFLRTHVNKDKGLVGEIVQEAIIHNDPIALNVLEEVTKYIGIACLTLLRTLDPERIIVGGGVSAMGDPLLRGIRDSIVNIQPQSRERSTRIVLSELGKNAGILGAVAVVRERLDSDNVDVA